jgi:hypothetical protein
MGAFVLNMALYFEAAVPVDRLLCILSWSAAVDREKGVAGAQPMCPFLSQVAPSHSLPAPVFLLSYKWDIWMSNFKPGSQIAKAGGN